MSDASTTPPPVQPAPAAAPAAAPALPAKKHNNGETFAKETPDLFRKLALDVEADERPKPAAKPKEEPTPAAAADQTPEGGTPPTADPDRGIRVSKKKSERPEPPSRDAKPAAPVAAPAPAPAPAAPAELDSESLTENEREMLEDAQDAERLLGAEYKGFSGKVKKFLKEHTEFVEKSDFDENSQEYQDFLAKNQPRLSTSEMRKIERARIRDEVQRDTGKEIAEVKFRRFQDAESPKIEAMGSQVFNEVGPLVLPQDVSSEVVRLMKDLGPQAGEKEARRIYKLEFDAAERVLVAAVEDMKEYERMGIKDPDTGRFLVQFDPNSQQHQRIKRMQDEICDSFLKVGGQGIKRNGKWFATRVEWQRMPESARSQYWTFSQREIIDLAKKGIPGVVSKAIAMKKSELEALGAKRELPAPASRAPAASTAPGHRPVPSPDPSIRADASGVHEATRRLHSKLSSF